MKKLFYWVFAATLVCGEGMLTSCANDSADNPVVTPRQRVINFEGIDNARDMGSLVMQDGRIVRFDMLVRSGKPYNGGVVRHLKCADTSRGFSIVVWI